MRTETEGNHMTTYFHEDCECFVPSWLIDSLDYGLGIPTDSSWECSVIREIGYSLASEIQDEATFEVFLSSIEEFNRIREEMRSAVERWGEEVKREFSMALSRYRETKEKDRYCILCMTNYRQRPDDVCGECKRTYAQEAQRVRAQNYLARRSGLEASLTLGEWISTLKSYQYMCAYCQDKPYRVLEHFIPMVKGGGTTKENCLPSCQSCNVKKGNEHPEPRALR
jgi:5-methylcytosine-specific restriction endonuclease McrA